MCDAAVMAMVPLAPAAPPAHALWEHQRAALDWLEGKDAAVLHVAMGGGKTRIAIERARADGAGRVLIVAPLSVCPVWERELGRWWPGHPPITCAFTGRVQTRADGVSRALANQDGAIVVANYDAFWRGPLGVALASATWDLVVFDESHRLKSPSGRAARFARKIRGKAKLALTGTPQPHGPLDWWGQIMAITADGGGIVPPAYAAFRARYAIPGRLGPWHVVGYRNLDDLAARLRPIVYRVEADAIDRPPLQIVDIPVLLEPEAMRAYRRFASDLVLQLAEQDGVGRTISVQSVLTLVLRLQQFTGGWLPADDGTPVRVSRAKEQALADMLEDAGPDEPLVVFGQFHRDLDTAADVAGADYRELSGRINQLAEWQAGGGRVLGVQYRAGSVGVSMTRAAIGVMLSLTYSAGDEQQAIARLHRPGQTRPVTIYRLIARGTIDERIARVLAAKGDVASEIAAMIARGDEL